jgi:hypothetical protein
MLAMANYCGSGKIAVSELERLGWDSNELAGAKEAAEKAPLRTGSFPQRLNSIEVAGAMHEREHRTLRSSQDEKLTTDGIGS